MALTLVATPKAADANAYLTRAEADAYFETRLHVSKWTSATNATKDAAIVWATAIMERAFEWQGSIVKQEQALSWPRYGIYDRNGRVIDHDTVPANIKHACAEFAFSLIQIDRTKEYKWLGLGLGDVLIGSIRTVVNRENVFDLVPKHVVQMVVDHGTLSGSVSTGMRQIKLLRT